MRFLALLLISTAACSPAPAPVASSRLDPSNPNAPESPMTSAPAPIAPASASAATAYVCPMHPEVTSDHPGTCPKCGMHLVPKK